MTYLLNKSQKAIQKAALEFAKGEFDSNVARELDKKGAFPESTWKKAAMLGFIGTHHPEKYAGGGMGNIDNVLVSESFSIIDSTLGSAIMLSDFGAEWLVKFGSQTQKASLLPEIFEGLKKSGFAVHTFFEQGEADIPSLKTTSSKNKWRLNGEIKNVMNGKDADFLFVLCNDYERENAVDRICMLAVDKKSPGVILEREDNLLGLRMNGMSSFQFENVEINASDFIGKPGQGYTQLYKTQPAFLLIVATLALGTAQGAFERALNHVKGREQFGKKIANFQVIRHKLADMAIQIEQVRCLTYEAAKIADLSKKNSKIITMANLAATSTAVNISYEAIQLLGGYGYTNEYDVERCYRDAKTLQLLSGHKHNLLDQISTETIGKLKN